MCEQYEDDPYSSFAFGGDHRSDVDFGFGHAHPQGWPNQPTLQMSANRALRGLRNHLEKDFDWGKYMMDANGLLPLEGFLSDTFSVPFYLCKIFGPSAAPNCDKLPEFLTHELVRMSVGFLRSMDMYIGHWYTRLRCWCNGFPY